MDASAQNTLLALMLALRNLEVSLSPNEQAALEKVGQQLALRPKAWASIEKTLMSIIVANASLNRLYQAAKAQLDVVDIPSALLPTQAELEQEIPTPKASDVLTKGYRDYLQNQPDSESKEIINMVVKVLTTENAATTAKQLSGIERIKKFLQQPNI